MRPPVSQTEPVVTSQRQCACVQGVRRAMARITVAFMLGALLAMAGCSAEAQSSESMELGTEDADSSRPEATTPPAGMALTSSRLRAQVVNSTHSQSTFTTV